MLAAMWAAGAGAAGYAHSMLFIEIGLRCDNLFTICLFISPDLDGHRAPQMRHSQSEGFSRLVVESIMGVGTFFDVPHRDWPLWRQDAVGGRLLVSQQ